MDRFRDGRVLLGFMGWPEALSFFQSHRLARDKPEAALKAWWEGSTDGIDKLSRFDDPNLDVEAIPNDYRSQPETVASLE